MLLEALEQDLHTGFTEQVVLPHDLTVEHVLPQEWAAHWPLPITDDPDLARTRREAAKHTIGNLTLVTGKLNPKLSNGPWTEKRETLRKYSVLLISNDIRQAETWDEAAIAERGDHLARRAVSLWWRPEGVTDQATTRSTDLAPAPPSEPPGSSASALADEAAFAEVLTVADGVGVGEELRRIVVVCRDLGLHPRPYRHSVMVSPPDDRRSYLFTVWPQAKDGGSFRIWSSPAAFARFFTGVSLTDAQAELGATEGPDVLPAADVDRLLASVRRLVGVPRPGAGLEEVTEPHGDDADAPVVPAEVEWLMEMRSSPTTAPLVRRLAEEALGMDGVRLRAQSGKGEPSYFQIRHPRFSQVVAYVRPRYDDVYIEYRLPSDWETYGVAKRRENNFYGITFKVEEDRDVDDALRLLRDALGRSE